MKTILVSLFLSPLLLTATMAGGESAADSNKPLSTADGFVIDENNALHMDILNFFREDSTGKSLPIANSKVQNTRQLKSRKTPGRAASPEQLTAMSLMGYIQKNAKNAGDCLGVMNNDPTYANEDGKPKVRVVIRRLRSQLALSEATVADVMRDLSSILEIRENCGS